MKVLYLLPRAPFPANNGETVRNSVLLRAVREEASRLDVVTLPQPPGAQAEDGLVELEALVDGLAVVGRPVNHYVNGRASRMAALAGRPYHLSVSRDSAIRRAVERALGTGSYDVILASQLTMAASVPIDKRQRMIFDSHNVESVRLASIIHARRFGQVAGWAALSGVRRLERSVIESSRLTLACSDLDASQLRALAPSANIDVLPNGAHADEPQDVSSEPRSSGPLLFLASLDYSANVDSLTYLIDEILPLMERPHQVIVAGSNAGRKAMVVIRRAPDNVRYVGQLDDPREAMRTASALLVPLRTGSGTRLKILEGLSVGVPIVSTSKGCEGLNVRAGEDLLVADRPTDFAKAIDRVISDEATALRLQRSGRRLIETMYEWSEIGKGFQRILRDVGERVDDSASASGKS